MVGRRDGLPDSCIGNEEGMITKKTSQDLKLHRNLVTVVFTVRNQDMEFGIVQSSRKKVLVKVGPLKKKSNCVIDVFLKIM